VPIDDRLQDVRVRASKALGTAATRRPAGAACGGARPPPRPPVGPRRGRSRRWYPGCVPSQGGDRTDDVIRGLSFGSVADQYERYRLDYSDEVADAVQQYAGRPLRSALEVGAGTGKATRLFAARDIHVTALEPDAEMAHVLARTTRGLPVAQVLTTFEQFETTRRFDLVYAAAAWHWKASRGCESLMSPRRLSTTRTWCRARVWCRCCAWPKGAIHLSALT